MKRISVYIFILLLIIPVVGLLSCFKSEELQENHELRRIRNISIQRFFDPMFYSKVDSFINDHFVYRGVLIRAKSFIDYRIFNSSVSSKVHIGKNEWLYYRDELRDYQKNDCNAIESMREIAIQLNSIERVLEASGKKFIFVVAPNKSTIYPENVGLEQPHTRCDKNKYDLLLEAFNEYPVKGFIRLDDKLSKAKQEKQLYYQFDTHWNVNGAILASITILKHLNPISWEKYFPEVELISGQQEGDLARIMSLKFRSEELVVKNIHYPVKYNLKTLEPLVRNYASFEIKVDNPPNDIIQRTVMFHDSFMAVPLQFFKSSFEQLGTYWLSDLSKPRAIDDIRRSQIVLIEVVERNLSSLQKNLKDFRAALQ